MEKRTGFKVRFFRSEITINAVLWTLTGGDASKTAEINRLDVTFAYDWYYNLRVKELNEMLYNIETIKSAKE